MRFSISFAFGPALLVAFLAQSASAVSYNSLDETIKAGTSIKAIGSYFKDITSGKAEAIAGLSNSTNQAAVHLNNAISGLKAGRGIPLCNLIGQHIVNNDIPNFTQSFSELSLACCIKSIIPYRSDISGAVQEFQKAYTQFLPLVAKSCPQYAFITDYSVAVNVLINRTAVAYTGNCKLGFPLNVQDNFPTW